MNLSYLDTDEILQKALKTERLFPEEAIHLCEHGDLLRLSLTARELSRRLNPEGKVGYGVSKTVVYSNVCQPECPFCEGYATKDDPHAFTRSADEVIAEVGEAVAQGATEIILQGGHRIDLPWEYYTGLVKAIKEQFPAVQILAYSPTEIMVFNVLYHKATAQVIGELKEAGMGGLFAGGSPTLKTRTPEYRALLRGPWNEWIDVVHRCADAGIPVIAPFVFGLGESARERVGHLYRIRAIQERTTTRGQTAFAALSVCSLTPPPEHRTLTPVSGHQYLRMVALGRILLPNIRHVASSFPEQGAKVAQVALQGGADDLGGTHLEFGEAELAAGRVGAMTAEEMERLIHEAGFTPARRTAW